MSYQEATAWLDALGIDAMKKMRPNMARIETICEALDHPERAAPAIHVTGTNGKTSTARIAASLLAATGLSVGTYTSPHLESVRERITLNGDAISKTDFGDLFAHLRPYLEHVEGQLRERLTYFEVLTAMFFLWAAEAPVDAMVVEVGLGGRWDATNVVPSSVAAITNVGLDHTGLLGLDRETIAHEKSGIIKQGSSVVTGERTPSVLSVIEAEAAEASSDFFVLDRDFGVIDNRIAVGGRYLSMKAGERDYEDLYLPLHGSHQGVNAAVALEATGRFLSKPLDHEVVMDGFAGAVVPGRLETIRLVGDDAGEGGKQIVLDVAHNPDGMSALVTGLLEAFAFERAVVVLGILADKDYRGMLNELARMPCTLILTQSKSVRSVEPSELKSAAEEAGLESLVQDDVGDALKTALATARPGELVCITGSHYVVGEARSRLTK